MIPLKESLTSGPLPRVTIALIVVNLLVLGWQLTLSGNDSSTPELAAEHVSKRDQAAIELGAIPFRLTHPGSACGIGSEGIVCGEDGLVEAGGTVGTSIPDNLDQAPWWLTPITSMFLHADVLHVAINMLFLWIFGGAVEALIGPRRFFVLYLAAGFLAAYAQSLIDPAATGPLIGAAGAVSGALGAYLVLRPRGRVVTLSVVPLFAGLLEAPVLLLALVWFALQLLGGVGNLASTDIASGGSAYLAHVGGFAVGLVAGWLITRHGPTGSSSGSPAAPGAVPAP
ncbi:MAG TPA: rhomboid family intramembrane serine protease [Solirubrobacterales bacterium]|nr:rhomboid family intramembrane serine protease [Solirubrobacterales bacterium]